MCTVFTEQRVQSRRRVSLSLVENNVPVINEISIRAMASAVVERQGASIIICETGVCVCMCVLGNGSLRSIIIITIIIIIVLVTRNNHDAH